MNSMDFLTEIQQKINEDFESQNPELFDTVFEIEGKKLFAHKYRLSIASTTFKSMLSERWNSKNDVIKLTQYKFENFKELLTFIYSGKCNLNNSNIFTMTDMAEFYQIEHLKKLCDDFASKMRMDLTNIFEFIGFSSKYSLAQMKKSTENFIAQNFTNLVKSDEFLKADKSGVEEIVKIKLNGIEAEEVFQAIYQWAEYQATEKQLTSFNKNFIGAIKAEISDFLPYFQFKKMKLTFLHGFVVRKGFLFSYEELSDILENAYTGKKCTVKITNSNGKTLSGSLPSDSDAIEIIKSLKNLPSDFNFIFWETELNKPPSSPSLLKKKNGIKWYLIYYDDGDIGVKHFYEIDFDNYLIAEMTADNGEFYVTGNCKIEIC